MVGCLPVKWGLLQEPEKTLGVHAPLPRRPCQPPALPPWTSPHALLTIEESITKGNASTLQLTTDIPEPTEAAYPCVSMNVTALVAWGPAEGLGSTHDANAVETYQQTRLYTEPSSRE